MIDFMTFIVTGEIGSIRIGVTEDRIIRTFGQPDVHTPARKSYPTMLVYGSVEFWLRRNSLDAISINLADYISFPDQKFRIESIPIDDLRTLDAIKDVLRTHQVGFSTDSVMSDESQTVLITSNGVHLAFGHDGLLTKVVAVKTATGEQSVVPH